MNRQENRVVLFVSRAGGDGTGGGKGHALSRKYYSSAFPGLARHEHVVPLPRGIAPWRKLRTFMSLREGYMSGVSRDVVTRFERTLAEVKPCAVMFDSSLFGPLAAAAKLTGCVVITQFQNCEYDFFCGEATLRGGLGGDWLRAAYRSEQMAVESSDLMFALSAYDQHRIEHVYEAHAPIFVANPLLHSLHAALADRTRFRSPTPRKTAPLEIVFLGSAWYQNRLACEKLINGWRRGNAKLKIVGQVGDWVHSRYSAAELADRGVEVLGYVESLDQVLQQADAMACPLTLGSGVKVKIIDALANGCPALVSREAMHGLEFAVPSGFVQPLGRTTLDDLQNGRLSSELDWSRLLNDLTHEVETQQRARDAALAGLGLLH